MKKQAAILALASLTSLSAYATSSNDVYFDMGNIQDFGFEETFHAITRGETWGGISNIKIKVDHWGMLTIKADRTNSQQVADDFKAAAMGSYEFGSGSNAIAPQMLNFMIEGNMYLKADGEDITCEGMLLGQGSERHSGIVHNIWWISAHGMIQNGAHVGRVLCQTASGRHAVVYFSDGSDVNRFNVQANIYPW
ncbi:MULTISPECIES: hypothetical protein [unclassified Paludibacterium]|uniref:hypothetical protein n=1 Tax=unclassified Paludibacterium TaxID=2618429 RepID=UPI001C03F0E1|nr:hypothetical protein [Paludibacterium sp. B53371]BEV71710.1 hypothetical protein THUN1379_11920 [Paludibacterium sp. THUN1379]